MRIWFSDLVEPGVVEVDWPAVPRKGDEIDWEDRPVRMVYSVRWDDRGVPEVLLVRPEDMKPR